MDSNASRKLKMHLMGHTLTLQNVNLAELPTILIGNIQELCVSNCSSLSYLPGLIAAAPSLRQLSISDDSATTLPAIQHSCITSLEFISCRALTSIQDSLPQSLPRLQQLTLNGATNLRQLPADIGSLEQLQTLNLSNCSSLTALPGSLIDATSLTLLDLSNCTCLERLPNYICNLRQLKHVDLSGCTRLAHLPTTLGKLKQLEILDLSGCSSLQVIPDRLLELPGLEIRLAGCSILKQLTVNMLTKQEQQLQEQYRCIQGNRGLVPAGAAAPLLAADAEDAVAGRLSSSGKKQLSICQRHFKRVRKLVNCQADLLKPLQRMSKVLMVVAVIAVVLMLVQVRHDMYMINTYGTAAVQHGQAEVEDLPGVKRLHFVELINTLGMVVMTFFALAVIALISALAGIGCTAFASMARPQLENQDLEAGRFWLLLVFAWGLSCISVAACYTSLTLHLYQYLTQDVWSRAEFAYYEHDTYYYYRRALNVFSIIAMYFMPGFCVLGLGAAWLVENLGRLFPGMTAVHNSMRMMLGFRQVQKQ